MITSLIWKKTFFLKNEQWPRPLFFNSKMNNSFILSAFYLKIWTLVLITIVYAVRKLLKDQIIRTAVMHIFISPNCMQEHKTLEGCISGSCGAKCMKILDNQHDTIIEIMGKCCLLVGNAKYQTVTTPFFEN